MFNRYYKDELSFLRELGREFAQKHEEAGRLLDEFGYDPDVERLLEGVAFLTGRIRQKLDDELPEITHALVQVLWPHYLRPVPSMSILAFKPRQGMLRCVHEVRRGTEVASVPKNGTVCRFRTANSVLLAPLHIVSVRVEQPQVEASALRVSLEVEEGARLLPAELPYLRLFLHGERETSLTLYHWLLRKTRRVTFDAHQADGEVQRIFRTAEVVRPVGWDSKDALLDYATNSFPGYRYLQEYFALPERYRFVDITGLDRLPPGFLAGRFDIVFELDEPPPPFFRPTKENIRLFCSPIVNLFEADARPIRLDHLQHEYRVQVDASPPEHHEIYSIDEVTSFVRGTAERRRYLPLMGLEEPPKTDERHHHTYHVRLKPGIDGDEDICETYISFSLPEADSADISQNIQIGPPETISISATATNRHLPEALGVGDICRPTRSSPTFATFENLIRPTRCAHPPLERDLLWHLIALLSLNRLSIGKVETLRSLLKTYQFPSRNDKSRERSNLRLLSGLISVTMRPREAIYRGQVVRGLSYELAVKESHFDGNGEIFLFGSVLSEFLSLYATINSFVALTIAGVERGEKYNWPARIGQCPLL